MKSSKNKWKGTKITVNYLGNLDNKFGIKKKKILLEEDKLSPLSVFKSPIKQQEPVELHQGTSNFFNMRNNFEIIKIRDWEKDNNYYFLNYIKNIKYFDRVNNSKRILSNYNFGKKRNNSASFIFNKNPTRNKAKEYSFSIIKKNKNKIKKPILKLSNTNLKINHLSKKTISRVISAYFEKSIYKENKKINFNSNNNLYNQLKIFSPLTSKKSSANSNSIKDINSNNYLNYYNLNQSSKNNKSEIYNLSIVNNNKLNETDNKNKLLSSKLDYFQSKAKNINNIKVIPIQKKRVENVIEQNISKFIKKSSTFIDASTNTD